MRLEFKNLCLRTALPQDAVQLAAWWNDGAVMAHAGFPNGLGTTAQRVADRLREGNLMIEENGCPIGEANYRMKDETTAEIGIKICVPSCQNRGVGRKILSMLIRYLFDSGIKKIVLDTNLTNERAQHVYESLGFEKLRVNIDSWVDQLGRRQSSVDYALTEQDFVDFTRK